MSCHIVTNGKEKKSGSDLKPQRHLPTSTLRLGGWGTGDDLSLGVDDTSRIDNIGLFVMRDPSDSDGCVNE